MHGIYETEFDKLIQEKFKKVKEEIGKYKNKENETKKTSWLPKTIIEWIRRE